MKGLNKNEFEIIYKNKFSFIFFFLSFPFFRLFFIFIFIFLPCIFRSSFWENNDSRKKRENRKEKRHIKIENNFIKV